MKQFDAHIFKNFEFGRNVSSSRSSTKNHFGGSMQIENPQFLRNHMVPHTNMEAGDLTLIWIPPIYDIYA